MSDKEEEEDFLSHFSNSAICAAAILDAWRENDPASLDQKLTKAVNLDPAVAESAEEWERMELLRSIAGKVRDLLGTDRLRDSTNVYLSLLRHLAQPGAERVRSACGS